MLKRSVLLFLVLNAAVAAALYFLPYIVLVIASWAFVLGYIVWNELRIRGLLNQVK